MYLVTRSAVIIECGSVLDLGMAREFGILPNLADIRHGLNSYQAGTSATERLAQLRASL